MNSQFYLSHAKSCAIAAGELILSYYAKEIGALNIQHKEDKSPVTQADKDADQLIRQYLSTHTPFPVLSEEFQEATFWANPPPVYWLVDPLDGTKEFIARTDEFAVNIALIEENKPLLGVVYLPVSAEMYSAILPNFSVKEIRGGSAVPNRTRPFTPQFTLLVSRSHPSRANQALLGQWPEAKVLVVGSSIKFCRIAEGLGDVTLRLSETYTWDTAAGECVLRAAGGHILTITNDVLRYDQPNMLNSSFIAMGDRTLTLKALKVS